MLRLFLFAGGFWVAFVGYGVIAKHESFHQALTAANTIALLVLLVPFIATRG
ncbi:hypothetical protein DES32_1917 [Methylovirgula ligni]|uniref:Uncharacterized protein n=1 Tax=Methylovirgula ligni TaxID=569860 RepID=A0A3D9Z3Z5_9HYPH|nr:hypothetical protein [Methylovirgula ligni]REF85879.1 hypothetical protein DES32_1917 [Methylovirgula ligni]